MERLKEVRATSPPCTFTVPGKACNMLFERGLSVHVVHCVGVHFQNDVMVSRLLLAVVFTKKMNERTQRLADAEEQTARMADTGAQFNDNAVRRYVCTA